MDRVSIFFFFFFTFFDHFYVFDRKSDKGHSHLTKYNFDSVAISSFLIKFYGIDFVSKLCPYYAYCDIIMTLRYGRRH